MTHREKIREIAESRAAYFGQGLSAGFTMALAELIESAILSAIEAVLGAEPSEGMLETGKDERMECFRTPALAVSPALSRIYRAMSAELIKELKC